VALQEYSESSIETACVHYEYGNALFRTAARNVENSCQTENVTGRKVSDGAVDFASDFDIALEEMENAFAIIDEYLCQKPTSKSSTDDHKKEVVPNYHSWALDQVPRILTGIGDLYSEIEKHAFAVDAYLRATSYREARVQDKSKHERSVEVLNYKRLLCESEILVAESLLRCPKDSDVEVLDENGEKTVIVTAAERIDYARGYYEKAREDLQNTLVYMAKSVKSCDPKQFKKLKEDICFLSTMVMGLGINLSEYDDQTAPDNDTEQKAKKLKSS